MTPSAPGPQVEDKEDVFRGIPTPAWWVETENRPSSAAFKHPDFSVDVVSLAGSHTHTLGHLPEGSGVVRFNCGDAVSLGFIIRLENDPNQPANHAHANVYNAANLSKRKKMAAKLAAKCIVVLGPNLSLLAANSEISATDSQAEE